MKRCPVCQFAYADETLKFCRQDGTPLIFEPSLESSETAILLPEAEATRLHITTPTESPSTAVLPFVNISADRDYDYFCDGLAEELLNGLARLPGLKVAARTSAFAFKGKNASVNEICRTLNVSTVLEGSLRKSGNRLRITVQLVNAEGFQLWSEKYDRGMEDVLEIQDDITLAVIDILKVKLLEQKPSEALKRGTDNSAAYEFYLRGRYCWNKRTGDDIKRAIGFFEQAIDRDSNYALAYVGLADCYTSIGVYAGVSASDALPLARAAATLAVERDDSLAEAHASLGQVYYRSLDWDHAEKEYQRAISLSTNYPTVHHWYSELFRAQRRFLEALQEIKHAQGRDPLSHVYGSFLGEAYNNLGDVESAIAEWERVIDLEPTFALPHFFMAHALAARARFEDAISKSRRAVELSGRGNLFLGGLGYVLAASGKRDEALEVLEELKRRYSMGETGGYPLAHVSAGLRQNDEALAWLESDFDKGNTTLLAQVAYTPIYSQLRHETRYRELLKRMGLSLD